MDASNSSQSNGRNSLNVPPFSDVGKLEVAKLGSISHAAVQNVVFVLNDIAMSVGHTIKESSNMTMSMVVSNSSKSFRTELCVDQKSQVALIQHYSRNGLLMTDSEQVEWMNIILLPFVNLKKMVVLDGCSAKGGHFNEDENSNICYLGTENRSFSSFSSEGVICSTSFKVKSLPIGHVLTGPTAALLCYCQARRKQISAVVFLALRQTAYTVQAAKSFERIWPCLVEVCAEDSCDIPLPSLQDYQRGVRNDVFVLNTNNLYT